MPLPETYLDPSHDLSNPQVEPAILLHAVRYHLRYCIRARPTNTHSTDAYGPTVGGVRRATALLLRASRSGVPPYAHARCTHGAHAMHTRCTRCTHDAQTHCTHSMHTRRAHNAHAVHTQTHDQHTPDTEVPLLFQICNRQSSTVDSSSSDAPPPPALGAAEEGGNWVLGGLTEDEVGLRRNQMEKPLSQHILYRKFGGGGVRSCFPCTDPTPSLCGVWY
eukprot:755054-Rhodomonas_salina.3